MRAANLVQIQIRLPLSLRRRLDAEAKRRAVSRNFLAERAISEALERWEVQPITQEHTPI